MNFFFFFQFLDIFWNKHEVNNNTVQVNCKVPCARCVDSLCGMSVVVCVGGGVSGVSVVRMSVVVCVGGGVRR